MTRNDDAADLGGATRHRDTKQSGRRAKDTTEPPEHRGDRPAMNAEALLARLDKAKRTGSGRWLARCPAHDDRSPSLSVRELDDGRVLVNCFAGCSASDVVASVGLDLSDLFPARASNDHVVRGEPHIGADVLRAMVGEVVLIVLQGAAVARGDSLSDADRQRTLLAAQRVLGALDATIPPLDRFAEYREAVRIVDEDFAEAGL